MAAPALLRPLSLVLLVVLLVTSHASTPCPSGWSVHGNYCYQVRGMTDYLAKAWAASEADCRRENGNLTSVTSASEQKLLYTLLRFNSTWINVDSVYIGLNSRLTTGGYRWSDGSPVAYTNWKKEFQTKTGKDCVAILTVSGRWTDRECDELTGYICKRLRGMWVSDSQSLRTSRSNGCSIHKVPVSRLDILSQVAVAVGIPWQRTFRSPFLLKSYLRTNDVPSI
eukprot:m.235437 g.235437  ORF g.235437 m.235437 type:complete len:225 (+) comp40125_c0_seq27:102-776(+)